MKPSEYFHASSPLFFFAGSTLSLSNVLGQAYLEQSLNLGNGGYLAQETLSKHESQEPPVNQQCFAEVVSKEV